MSKIKDLDRSYVTMRNVTLGSVISTLLIGILSIYLVSRAYDASGQRVYVVDSSGSHSALAASGEQHTIFEARNLVSSFMQTMFGHDQYSFKSHLDAALPLIEDRGGRRIFDAFKTGQVFENYVRYGARQTITVDSSIIDMREIPYTGRVYVKQRVYIGDQQSQSKPLAARFDLVPTNRTDANPYGLLITNFDYIPYAPPISEEEKNELKAQAQERQRKLAEAAAAAGVTPTR